MRHPVGGYQLAQVDVGVPLGLIIDLSVWGSVESLSTFVYRTAHADVMRGRREWFVPMREAVAAAWWIPAGTLPTMAEAMARLDLLRRSGPCRQAFTLQRPFARPDATDVLSR